MPSTLVGHHGAGGHGDQVQAPILTPCCYVGIAVVHSEAGDVALQGEALPYFTFSCGTHAGQGQRRSWDAYK